MLDTTRAADSRKQERKRNKKEKDKHITDKKKIDKEKERVPRIVIMERDVENEETQYKIMQKKNFDCKFIVSYFRGSILTLVSSTAFQRSPDDTIENDDNDEDDDAEDDESDDFDPFDEDAV